MIFYGNLTHDERRDLGLTRTDIDTVRERYHKLSSQVTALRKQQGYDIDTRLQFRRAAPKIRFMDHKLLSRVEVHPIVGYYTIPLFGNGPDEVFDGSQPWVMGVPENDWWELIGGVTASYAGNASAVVPTSTAPLPATSQITPNPAI